jgi:hypothetical protein
MSGRDRDAAAADRANLIETFDRIRSGETDETDETDAEQ